MIFRKIIFHLVCLILITFVFPSLLEAQRRKAAPRTTKRIVNVIAAPDTPSDKNPPADVKPKTLGLTIERYRKSIDVNKDGTSVETIEISERFDTKDAIDRFAKEQREFNSDLSDVTISDVYVEKGDGSRKPIPPDSIKIRKTPQAEAAPSFSSLMVAELDPGNIAPGELLHFIVKTVSKRTYFQGKYDGLTYLPAIFSWKAAEVNLSAPADYPLQVETIGFDGGKLPDNADGKVHWKWTANDRKALEIEGFMLDSLGTSPRLAITSFRDFEELGNTYWAEAKKKAVVTPELRVLADEITKDSKSPQEQAYAIYQWVNKNVRYLSIVLDRGGWIPHSSSDIVANRYGDCKDYSTLLNTLLRAKNIESYPVLIRSDFSSWFPSVAVPMFFNHEVLYIPSLDLFADATVENTRLGLIPPTIVGKKGFLAGEKVGIIQTPSNRPNDNQLLSSTDVILTPNGDLKAVSKNTYLGRSEIIFRPMFSDSSIRQYADSFVSIMLAAYGQSGRGRVLNIANPFKVSEPFGVDFEVTMDGYSAFLPSGTFTVPVALNLNNPLAFETFTKSESRKSDLPIGAMKIREEYSISFPAGVTPQADAPVQFENEAGSFVRQTKVDNGKVIALRELVIKKDVIRAEEYASFRELISHLVDNYNIQVKYVSAANVASRPSSARPAKLPATSPFGLPDYFDEKKISPREASQLESSLLKDPDNLEAHRNLLRYYGSYQLKEPPARVKARIRHYRWFIEHYPEKDNLETFGPGGGSNRTDAEFAAIKPVWLAAVEKDKSNAVVRLHAYEFIVISDPETAENLLVEGIKLDETNYKFPLTLSKKYADKKNSSSTESISEKERRLAKEMKYGQMALAIMKTERSAERNEDREKLLENLAQVAVEISDYSTAKSLATELILDFGQQSSSRNYDSAAHVGNIVLGRVALKQGDKPKAVEYLLIAIRAPLRKQESWLPNINTTLAKELLDAGEKDAVLEYLHMCEGLWNLKNEKKLFDYQSKALQKWQQEIKMGHKPSFDFYKP